MFEGKVNAAIKFLSGEENRGVLNADEEVIKALKEKHPPQAPIQCNVLLQGPIDYVSPSYFDEINESMIKNAARLTKGAAGPSNLEFASSRARSCFE